MINRKGVASVPAAIAVIVIMVLVALLFAVVYSNIVEARALASAHTTSKDIGMKIDAAYAAPGDMYVRHEVDLSDAYPVIGSMYINHEEHEVCTSEYTEDEMWLYIMNSGITAFVGGKVSQQMWKHREGIKTGLRAVKNNAKYANPFAYGRALKRLPHRLLRKPLIKYGTKGTGQRVVKEALWDMQKSSGGLIRKAQSKGFIRRTIGKVLAPAGKFLKWSFGGLKRGMGKLMGKVVRKLYFKSVNTILKSGSSRFAVGASKLFIKITGKMTADTLQVPIMAATEATLWGAIVAKIMYAINTALDVIFVYIPLWSSVDGGHDAATTMLASVDCYEYARKSDPMFVGPPNCKSEITKDSIGEIFIPTSKLVIEDGEPVRADAPKDIVYNESEQCLDAPHAMIAYDSVLNDVGRALTAPTSFITGEKRISKWDAREMIIAPRIVCDIIAYSTPYPAPGVTLATKCKVAYWASLLTLMTATPEQFYTMAWGSNILPKDEYHYIEFPLVIDINNEYDSNTGSMKMNVRKTL